MKRSSTSCCCDNAETETSKTWPLMEDWLSQLSFAKANS